VPNGKKVSGKILIGPSGQHDGAILRWIEDDDPASEGDRSYGEVYRIAPRSRSASTSEECRHERDRGVSP
jgi:hypothetical protein